jgi:hypothetical protein
MWKENIVDDGEILLKFLAAMPEEIKEITEINKFMAIMQLKEDYHLYKYETDDFIVTLGYKYHKDFDKYLIIWAYTTFKCTTGIY